MKTIIYILIFISSLTLKGQTVIEMGHPADADLILLETKDSSLADFFIYKTDYKRDAAQWDYVWKFKKWGFCNFSVYILKDISEMDNVELDEGIEYIVHGTVYFTTDCEKRGIKKKGFALEGIMKVNRTKKLVLSNPCHKK